MKVIDLSSEIKLMSDWTANNVYKYLQFKDMRPIYNQENEDFHANIDIVIYGVPHRIIFYDGQSEAKIRRVEKYISRSPFPFERIILYKRHWWV